MTEPVTTGNIPAALKQGKKATAMKPKAPPAPKK